MSSLLSLRGRRNPVQLGTPAILNAGMIVAILTRNMVVRNTEVRPTFLDKGTVTTLLL
jgi:hypothetical protein